jgi:endonuclease
LSATFKTRFGGIGDLEPGLSIIDAGNERRVPSGFIDTAAEDRDGATVAIELKAGTADRDAVGQILSYMGDLMEGAASVRGILVAGDFTPRAVAAARAAPNVCLVRYAFRFSFGTALPSPSNPNPSRALR